MMLAIKNGQVFYNNKLVKTNIYCSGGKIQELTSEDRQADQSINASGLIVIPGAIDPHEHCRDLGQAYKEDFLTASMAAAKGGITTILAMPNTEPPVVDSESLEQERMAAKKSIVNYGLFVAGIDGNSEKIRNLTNIAGIKIYMNVTTGNLKVSDETELQKLFSASKRIAVHAEGHQVEKAISLIKNTPNTLYLVHITSRKELDMILLRKDKRIFCEVCPHHLYLIGHDRQRLKGYAIMKPPLQSQEDAAALWDAIRDGTVDTIGTDHAPHTREEKEQANPLFGVTGSETMLPLLLHAVNRQQLTFQKMVDLISTNPARIFGIQKKGMIKVGYDADLTLIDMDEIKEVRNEDLLTKCKWSPFSGYVLKGWPVATIVNGNVVFERGKINKGFKGKEVRFS